MSIKLKRITIIKPNINAQSKKLLYFSNSLGLVGLRDKEKSCFKVFKELVICTKRKKPLSTDELADRSDITRATVIHHLNKLMDSGLIICKDNRYALRMDNLTSLIKRLQNEVDECFKDLHKIAKELDKKIN